MAVDDSKIAEDEIEPASKRRKQDDENGDQQHRLAPIGALELPEALVRRSHQNETAERDELTRPQPALEQ